MSLSWVSDSVVSAQAEHRRRVEKLYAGEAVDQVAAIAGRNYGGSHGLHGTNEIDMLGQPEAWLADVLADMRTDAELFADPVTFRPMVIEIDPLGVHFIDALLGARVHFQAGQVWNEELPIDPEELKPPDLANSALLAKALALAARAVEATHGLVLLTTPVLSCPINTGINLFGQRLLEEMVARPEVVHRALGIIADTIKACISAFAKAVPLEVLRNSVACNRYAPEGFGQIDGCATQLVSKEHYRGFFAPLDAELLGAWPQGGMIHLCGAHTQHIGAWREMRELRSVQVNDRASEDLEQYLGELREDQILYVTPTQTMTVERILEITGGRRLVLQCPLEQPVRLSG